MATDRETAKVYFTKLEMEQVKVAAGYGSISGFIRRTVLGSLNGAPKSSGEVAGRAEPGSAASPVRSFGAGSSDNAESAPDMEFGIPEDGEAVNEVREPKDVQRDRDVPVSPGRAYAPVAAARTAKKPAAKRGKRDSKTTGKAGTCPHGFAIVDGITLCQRCR